MGLSTMSQPLGPDPSLRRLLVGVPFSSDGGSLVVARLHPNASVAHYTKIDGTATGVLAGNGIVNGDELGHGVTGACGDIDGDGFNDLATSANRLGSSSEGAIFVLFMHGNDTVKSYTRLS